MIKGLDKEQEKFLQELGLARDDLKKYIDGLGKNTLSPTSQNLVNKISSGTVKDLEEIEQYEQQLTENEEIFDKFVQDVEGKTFDIEEDLRKTFQDFQKDLQDIEKTYKKFLNQYDLKNLVLLSIECLNKKIPWQKFKEEICREATKKFLENVDLESIANVITNIKDADGLVNNLLGLVGKTKQNSQQELSKALEEIEKSIDIQDLCDSLSKNVPNFDSFFKIPGLLEERLEETKNFLPNLPTFNFDDDIKTVDFLESFEESMQKNIEKQVLTFFTSSVSSVLQQVIKNTCLNTDSFVGNSQIDKNELNNFLANTFGSNANQYADFVDDVMNSLYAGELCFLLSGNVNREILTIIKTIVEKKYGSLPLKDEEKITDFFRLLSNSIDLKFCENNENFASSLCLDNNKEELRKCLLEKTFNNSKHIDDLLEKIRKERVEDLRSLLSLLNQLDNSVKLPELCNFVGESEFVKNIQSQYASLSERTIDNLLKTVKTSYDQAIFSFVNNLVKDVEIGRGVETESIPLITENIVSSLQNSYNNQFKSAISSFVDSNENVVNVIRGQFESNEKINKMMNLEKIKKMVNENGFPTVKKRKVQPDLKEKLANGTFVSISDRNSFTFGLPTQDNSIGAVFDGSSNSILPLESKEKMELAIFGEKKDDSILENFFVQVSRNEKRERIVVQDNADSITNCKTYKVYLPVSFGLAEYDKLYNVGVNNSQPLMPDYGSVLASHYPHLYKNTTNNVMLAFYGVLGKIKDIANDLYLKKETKWKGKLSKRDFDRFPAFLYDDFDRNDNIQLPIIVQPTSEMNIFLNFFDVYKLRDQINEGIIEIILAQMELHWLFNIWPKLRIAYHYKVYQNGEAYLMKIDFNDKYKISDEVNGQYDLKETNIEDIVCFNAMNMGLQNWENLNLWGKLRGNQIFGQGSFKFNPFSSFAGLKSLNFNDSQSVIASSRVDRGMIQFGYGIPANELARKSSWFSQIQKISERFGSSNYLLPTYFGDLVTDSDNNLDKNLSWRGTSKSIRYIDTNSTNLNNSILSGTPWERVPIKNIRGKIVLEKSGVYIDEKVPKEFQISNVLDVGLDPLKTLKGQGKQWFVETANNNRVIYDVTTRDERFQEIKKKNFPLNYKRTDFYTNTFPNDVEKIGRWESSPNKTGVTTFTNIRKSVKNDENVYGHIWANMVVSSLKNLIPLSDIEIAYITKFYSVRGFQKAWADMLKRCASFVSFSPLFQTVEISNNEDNKFTFDDENGSGIASTNVLEMINFSPNFNFANFPCDIDLDLLRLSELRRKTTNEYKQLLLCDDKDKGKAMTKALMSAVVKLFIRIYTIEFIFGSIFVHSRVEFDQKIEDILSEFVYERLISEINFEIEETGDKKFKEDFFEVVASLWIDENPGRRPISCEDMLRETIKKNLYLSSNRLKDILYSPDVISNEKFKIGDILWEKIIPEISLPMDDKTYTNNGGRFYPNSLTFYQNQQLSRMFVGFDKIKNLSKIFDSRYSGFYLEKYYKPIWKKKYMPNERVLSGIVNIFSFNDYMNSIANSNHYLMEYLDELKVGMRLVYRPEGEEHEILSKIVKSKVSGLNYISKDTYEPGTSIEKPDFMLLKQTVHGRWAPPAVGASVTPNIFHNIKFEIFWKYHTEDELNNIKNMLSGDNWKTSLLTEQNEKNHKIFVTVGTGNVFSGGFEDFCKKYGERNSRGDVYANDEIRDFLKEVIYPVTIGSEKFVTFSKGSLQSILPPLQYAQKTILGESVLIPLINIEKTIPLSTSMKEITKSISTVSTIDDIQSVDCDARIKTSKREVTKYDFVKEYEQCFAQKFEKDIRESNFYQSLFELLFPIDKMFSILSLYITFYNRNTTDSLNSFHSVKNNVFSFLGNIRNSEKFQEDDEKISSLGGSLGVFSPSSIVQKRESNFFDINSIRNLTPYVMLKGLMETFDPNIAPAKKIVDVANNYKRDIIAKAKPVLKLIAKMEDGGKLSQDEVSTVTASNWLINLSKEMDKIPDLPIHVPSIFIMLGGIIPSPLGFAYLGFEALLGTDLLDRILEDSILKQKVEAETGISLESAKKFANIVKKQCK